MTNTLTLIFKCTNNRKLVVWVLCHLRAARHLLFSLHSVIGLILRSDHFLNLNIRFCNSILLCGLYKYELNIQVSTGVWSSMSLLLTDAVISFQTTVILTPFNPIFRLPNNKTFIFFYQLYFINLLWCHFQIEKKIFSMPHYVPRVIKCMYQRC